MAAYNRDELVAAGVIPVLIKLLTAENEDVQFYTAAALSNIAVDGKCRNPMEAVMPLAFSSTNLNTFITHSQAQTSNGGLQRWASIY